MAYYPYAVEKGGVYTLVGPDGTKAVFNDPLDPNYVGMLSDISGLDSAEMRESAADLTEADGGSHGAFYFARRPIVMTAQVFGHASVAERNARVDLARRASMALRSDATLSWKPSTRLENLSGNTNFEVDADGLSTSQNGGPVGSGFASSRTTTSPIVGTGSGEIVFTPNVAGGTVANFWVGLHAVGSSRLAPAFPGEKYSARVKIKVRTGVAPANLQCNLTFRNAANGHLASTGMTEVVSGNTTIVAPVVGTTYEFVANGITAPAGTANVSNLGAITGGANTTQVALQVDDVIYTRSATAPAAHFDGDDVGYYWQGDPGVSRSGDYPEMFTTLRRQQRFLETGNWIKELQLPMVSEYATLFSTGLRTATGSPLTIDNRGSYTSYPIIEITGVSTNPRVTDANGGDFRTTGLTLASGEKVQFDMLNHTGVFTAGARVGQSANRYIDFTLTKWIALVGGTATNTVTFTSGGGTLRVIWRDVWA